MCAMTGADADALDRAATRVGEARRDLLGSQVRLTRAIHAAPWIGPSADHFRQSWESEHRRHLSEASLFLEKAVDELRRNAHEQRIASGEFPGSRRAAAGRPASRHTVAAIDPDQITNTVFDLLDISGVVPHPMGFGIGIGSGVWDLFMSRDGYGGSYHGVESVMDVLAITAAGVGLGALLLGGGAVVVGGAMIAGGVIKGVDMLLGTAAGKAFMGGVADVGRATWRGVTGALRTTWNSARSIGESGVRAVKDSARAAARSTVEASSRVVSGVADKGERLVGGLMSSGRRLLPGI